MEILYAKEITLPLYQAAVLLGLSALALFLGKLRVALLINYAGILYWVYWLNREAVLGKDAPTLNSFTLCYFGFGIVIIVLIVIGLLNRQS
jgi:hypothetical protein